MGWFGRAVGVTQGISFNHQDAKCPLGDTKTNRAIRVLGEQFVDDKPWPQL